MSAASVGERRIELMALHQIRRALRNPKQHAQDDIIASLQRFGLAELVLIDERTGLLIAGEGRINALDALKAADPGAPPHGVTVQGEDWLVPVQRGWASRDQREADAYLIASNRLSAKGGWDGDGLAQMMASLDLALEGVGFDPGELEELLGHSAQLDADAMLDQMAQGDPTAGLDQPPAAQPPPPAAQPPQAPARPPITSPFAQDQDRPEPQGPPGEPPPWPTGGAAPEHTGALPAASPPAQGGTEPQWFQLTYTATHDQRQTVHEAIRLAQDIHPDPGTSIAALTEICRFYSVAMQGAAVET